MLIAVRQSELKKTRDRGSRGGLKRELGELRKELRSREETATKQILKGASVILATNTGEWQVNIHPRTHTYTHSRVKFLQTDKMYFNLVGPVIRE